MPRGTPRKSRRRRCFGYCDGMSYVVMNVVDVPPERAAEFEHRFATRAGKVQNNPGFEAFELLKPDDGSTKYIAYTRWRSKSDFDAWVSSADFAAGHQQHAH